MFEQIDPLPGAQSQLFIDHWNGQAALGEGALDVRGHVVWPLVGVSEEMRVRGGDALEEGLQVGARAGVGILLNEQAGRGVWHENMADAASQLALLHHFSDLVSDFEEALAGGFDDNLALMHA